jgi:tetratricopeptide (TPR) repeat protein
MAKFNIKAKTFNEIEINPQVEVFIVVGNRKKDFLSLNVYSTLKSRIESDLKINNFNFYLISKDIEELIENDVIIDEEDLINKIYPELLKESENLQLDIQNPILKRAFELYENRDFEDAKKLLKSINKESLSKFDFDEYILLEFKLLERKDEMFEMYKSYFNQNRLKLKELYFDYIKYLEDIRDEKKPFKVFKEFENKFSISEFNDEEKAFYFYLKGRNFYYRGEFLLALEYLSRAIKLTKNEKLKANIYNTATNSFTDNLFFDEALQLANKAFEIRKKLKLPEIADTLSLIGGIYLKRKNPKKALNYFIESEKIQKAKDNRIYNYLAKTSVLLGYTNKAKEYLEKSKTFEDDKGFYVLTYLFFLYKTKSYKNMFEYSKNTIFLPENREKYDKVVLAWSYYLLSQKAFEEKLYFDGIQYLERAIFYFLKDKYILEAFFVSNLDLKLPKREEIYFKEILKKYEVKFLFEEYFKKHSLIADKYCEIFGISNSKKNNLQKFYKNPDKNKYFLI